VKKELKDAAANSTHGNTTDDAAEVSKLEAASLAANQTASAEDALANADEANATAAAYASVNASHLIEEYDATIEKLANGVAEGCTVIGSDNDWDDSKCSSSCQDLGSCDPQCATYCHKGCACNAAETTTDISSILPQEVNDAVADDLRYAESVIPPGGQRRLLMASSNDTNASALAAELKHQIAADTTQLSEDQLAAAESVNVTSEALDAVSAAESTFNNAQEAQTNADNMARYHAGRAAYIEAKVTAVDSYVGTHRGALHQTNCSEEKKFAFDVCFGRGAYKGQIYETNKAKEARASANAFQEDMAKNYAVVLETNKTYNADVHTEEDAEAAVKAATKKLHSDQDALINAQMAVKEQKDKLAAKEAEAAKAAQQAAAAAAMSEAMANSTSTSDVTDSSDGADSDADSSAELLQAEANGDELTGRHLLQSLASSHRNSHVYDHDDAKCHAALDQAFGECKDIVDKAYVGCTHLFKNVRL